MAVVKRWVMKRAVRPAAERAEAREPVGLGPGVHGAGRLVEGDDRGLAQEGAGQGDPLPLAHAQLRAALEPVPQQLIIAPGQVSDGLVGPCRPSRGLDLGAEPPRPDRPARCSPQPSRCSAPASETRR